MSETSFERNKRLLKPYEFKRVFDNTELRGGTSQILVLASANQLENPRIGFVFAKKNMKLAVDRNRVKRIIRESFRHQQIKLPALDFVILGKKGISELDKDRKSTRLNSSHVRISYAVFCLKKKKKNRRKQ